MEQDNGSLIPRSTLVNLFLLVKSYPSWDRDIWTNGLWTWEQIPEAGIQKAGSKQKWFNGLLSVLLIIVWVPASVAFGHEFLLSSKISNSCIALHC